MRAFFGHADSCAFVALTEREVITVAQGSPLDEPLALFERALVEAKADRSAIKEIAVDCGPDGFSSARRRVAVAAGLAFALGVPSCATGPLTPTEAAALPSGDFSLTATLAPRYSRPPNITKSKKSALLRP